MSGPNQWSRPTESTARGSNEARPTPQDDEAYRSEDSEVPNEPLGGYTARRSREVPTDLERTLQTNSPGRPRAEFFAMPSDDNISGTWTKNMSRS